MFHRPVVGLVALEEGGGREGQVGGGRNLEAVDEDEEEGFFHGGGRVEVRRCIMAWEGLDAGVNRICRNDLQITNERLEEHYNEIVNN